MFCSASCPVLTDGILSNVCEEEVVRRWDINLGGVLEYCLFGRAEFGMGRGPVLNLIKWLSSELDEA